MAGVPIDVLRRVPLFAELERRDLEPIARLFKERRFPAGETVVREGSGGGAFYVIEAGEAAITIQGDDRGTLRPGDFFGEIALLDEGTRMATITATSDLACWGLTLWEFRPVVQKNGAIAWGLLRSLARILRENEAKAAQARGT